MPKRMSYDTRHHQHRSILLHGYDCTFPPAFFVTICSYDLHCLIGEATNGTVHLDEAGIIADEGWQRPERLRRDVRLDSFVVIPKPLHGIAIIVPSEADLSRDLADPYGYCLHFSNSTHHPCWYMTRFVPAQTCAFDKPTAGSLSKITSAFKSESARRINRIRSAPGAPVWLSVNYDHILRTEHEWKTRYLYIELNTIG